MDKLIRKLEKEGKLKKQKAGIVQIETLLNQAILDLKEAKKISNIAERATYILAYMAMLKAGRALLTLSDAKHAFQDAISLVQRILKEVKSQNPQLELNFKLE